MAHCGGTFTYVETCYTDNTYSTTTACPTFVTRSGSQLSVETNDHTNAGVYFFEVSTSKYGHTDTLSFSLSVTDGCDATTVSSTSPGDIGILLN